MEYPQSKGEVQSSFLIGLRTFPLALVYVERAGRRMYVFGGSGYSDLARQGQQASIVFCLMATDIY